MNTYTTVQPGTTTVQEAQETRLERCTKDRQTEVGYAVRTTNVLVRTNKYLV